MIELIKLTYALTILYISIPFVLFVFGLVAYIVRKILGKKNDGSAKGFDVKWAGTGSWDSNWSNYV